jgi:mRNA-degrading endonuclease RelE of RelBE toxin-antitoxin system
MKIVFTRKAEKAFDRLPREIRKKTLKQLAFLDINIHHPSLRVKKLVNQVYFEARIDYQYRFVFEIENDTLSILSIGPHDSGLGKK